MKIFSFRRHTLALIKICIAFCLVSPAVVMASNVPTGKCTGILKPIFSWSGLEPGDSETLGILLEIDFDRGLIQAALRRVSIDQQGNDRSFREVLRDLRFTVEDNQPFPGAFSMTVSVPEDDPVTLDAVSVNSGSGVLIVGDYGEAGVCHRR